MNKQVDYCRILLHFVSYLHLNVRRFYLGVIEQAEENMLNSLRKVDASCAQQRAVLFSCSFLLHALLYASSRLLFEASYTWVSQAYTPKRFILSLFPFPLLISFPVISFRFVLAKPWMQKKLFIQAQSVKPFTSNTKKDLI